MTLQYTNASIHVFRLYFRTARAYPSGNMPMAAIDKLAIAHLSLVRGVRKRSHGKVSEDAAVQVLEMKVGGKIRGKVQLNAAVDRGEFGILSRVVTVEDL